MKLQQILRFYAEMFLSFERLTCVGWENTQEHRNFALQNACMQIYALY